MEKWHKLLSKIRDSKRNVAPDDLRQLMELRGFDSWLGQRGGHIRLFQHHSYPEIVASMAPNQNPQRVRHVNQCLRALKTLAEREEMS